MGAGLAFGEVRGDDFSIDLFSAPWFVLDEEGAGKAFLNRYAMEIDSCRQYMAMEKAGPDLYRIGLKAALSMRLSGRSLAIICMTICSILSRTAMAF